MGFVADTAELVHGYTFGQIESIARSAERQLAYTVLDREARYAAAFHGVVMCLYKSEEWPSRDTLCYAGKTAIQRDVSAEFHHHGYDSTAQGERPAMVKYWAPITSSTDFTESVIERLALPQVLATLSPREYEIIVALAAFGTQAAAADAIGMKRPAFTARVKVIRRKIAANWFGPETPRQQRHRAADACAYGHLRTEHGYISGGRQRCRVCKRSESYRNQTRQRHTRNARRALETESIDVPA